MNSSISIGEYKSPTRYYVKTKTSAPRGVAQWCGIPCASSWSLVRVVAGTMWGGGGIFMACIAPTFWLSWGARVRSEASLSQ